MISSSVLFWVRSFVYSVILFFLASIQILLRPLPSPLCFVTARLFHAITAYVTGFRIHVWGRPSSRQGTLFVSNHTSYADIMILGSLVHAAFVGKKEVAHYPLIGWMARLQKTSFIQRQRDYVKSQYQGLQGRLLKGESLILFPEGTTSDGRRVLPFMSSLFAAVIPSLENQASPCVQPVTIAYTRIDGMPVSLALKPLIAWYGDMSMAKHAAIALGLGRIEVDVIFHQPIEIMASVNRKELAKTCWDHVNAGYYNAFRNRGRLQQFKGNSSVPYSMLQKVRKG